jgi:ubiquinone biosynthesis protein COQ9
VTENSKNKILDAFLRDAAFDGWTDDTLARAAKKTGSDTSRLFPRGLTDVALAFSHRADNIMLTGMTDKKMAKMKVREKIALGVRLRLEGLTPHREAFRHCLTYMAMPPRSLLLPKMVWTTADHIWWEAGDNATDYNHYTKRILLSGVLSSVTLYWLNETSNGYAATWEFLDRRIDDVLKLGRTLSSFKRKSA